MKLLKDYYYSIRTYLKFMDRMLAVATPAKTENLENRLEVKEDCKSYLNVVVILIKHVTWSTVMLEVHGCSYNSVCQNYSHDDVSEKARFYNPVTGLICGAVLVLIDCYKLPSTVVSNQHMRSAAALNVSTNSPHLLKLQLRKASVSRQEFHQQSTVLT